MNSRSARKCLSENEIEDFLFHRLSGTTREVIEEHLLVCQTCLDKVGAEEDYVEAARVAARTLENEQLERAFQHREPAPPPAARWSWRNWGLALSAVAAALAIVMVVQFRQPASFTETEIALHVARDAGGQPAEAVASRPLQLTPDRSGLPVDTNLAWNLVDHRGRGVAHGSLTAGAGIKLPRGLAAGAYWVRLQRPNGELLREFALRVR